MISSLIYIKVFGYVKLMSRVLTILGVRPNVRCKAQHSDAIHNEIKKQKQKFNSCNFFKHFSDI